MLVLYHIRACPPLFEQRERESSRSRHKCIGTALYISRLYWPSRVTCLDSRLVIGALHNRLMIGLCSIYCALIGRCLSDCYTATFTWVNINYVTCRIRLQIFDVMNAT